jgi:hypothetical protein
MVDDAVDEVTTPLVGDDDAAMEAVDAVAAAEAAEAAVSNALLLGDDTAVVASVDDIVGGIGPEPPAYDNDADATACTPEDVVLFIAADVAADIPDTLMFTFAPDVDVITAVDVTVATLAVATVDVLAAIVVVDDAAKVVASG